MKSSLRTKIGLIKEIIYENRSIVKRLLYICCASSVCLALIVGSFDTMNNRSFHSSLYTRKLKDYREYLAKFYNQDYSVFSLTSKTSGRINKELSKFVNSKTTCVEFFHKENSVGTFGKCIGHNFGNIENSGWHITNSGIILVEKFKSDIKVVTVLTNDLDVSLTPSGFLVPLQMFHIENAIPAALWSLFFYLITYWLIAIAIVFYRIKERSENIIHDFSKLSTNLELTAAKLERHAKNETQVKKISHELNCLTMLNDACTHDGPVFVSNYNLGSLIDDFMTGYFINNANPNIDVAPFNKNLYLKCDRLYVYKILVNMFANAEKATEVNSTKISLTILEKPDSVLFVVSNEGQISGNNVFEKKFSFFNGNGRGLPIISKTAKLIGSNVTISNSEPNVAISFNAPISLELSCPALFLV